MSLSGPALGQQILHDAAGPTFRQPLVIGITADTVGVTHDPDAGDIGMAELAHQPIELASSFCGEVGFVEIEQYLAGIVEGDDLASRCFRLHRWGTGRYCGTGQP